MRKNCETIWSELVFVATILIPEILNKKDIFENIKLIEDNTKLEFNRKYLSSYLKDLELRSSRLINKYIKNVRESINDIIDSTKIEKIYFTGKNSNQFEFINKLNTDINTNKKFDIKYIKSDIYIKFIDESIIGISIKSSCKDTKTNYSIEKIFKKNLNICENIKCHRIQMLKDKFKNKNGKYTKEERAIANRLFYNKNNIYFTAINRIINENKLEFIKLLLGYLYPNNLPYQVYEFDGSKLKNISQSPSIDEITLERNENYETNTSAKLWYSIYQKNVEVSKFEIRGKQDLYKGSMQLMLYNI